jgi:hypothetical protein
MDAYLHYLNDKASDVDNIPHRIRGRVMNEDLSPSVLIADGAKMHVGSDVHSCTASAAAVAFWLNPSDRPMTLSELAFEYHAVNLASAVMDRQKALLVFNTPHHRFSVLRMGNEAVLLQSNQDDTRGGHRFTLSEWLRGGKMKRMSLDELNEMIRQLASAAIGISDHETVCATYFGGARFKRGAIEDYWAVTVPITVVL